MSHFNLTQKEIEALELLSKGLLYKEIASVMGISIGNLKQKVHKIYKKLGASNRTEALNNFQNINVSS